MFYYWEKSYDQPRQHMKKQRHYFGNKVPSSQSYVFSSSHVWMWELGYKESWALKNWCFLTMVLKNTLESPLDCKGIQPVHPKGNHSWIFIGRTYAEAETPTLWPPEAKNWLTGKVSDAGKDWRREEKGTTEDEMVVGWHHWLNGHEFEQALGIGNGQGSLVCCSPWGHKELDMTEQLNWTENMFFIAKRVPTQVGLNTSPEMRLWEMTDHDWYKNNKHYRLLNTTVFQNHFIYFLLNSS